jgi:hypothetical protein
LHFPFVTLQKWRGAIHNITTAAVSPNGFHDMIRLDETSASGTMDYNNVYPCQRGSTITVTTDIIRSESRLMTNSDEPEDGRNHGESEQAQKDVMAAAHESKRASARVLSVRRGGEAHEPCAGPVVYDRRTQKALPPIRPQSGFEESPEWRQHYVTTAKASKSESPCPSDKPRKVLPVPSQITADFSTGAIITATRLPDLSSTNTVGTGSKKLFCLSRPQTRQSFLKAGNLRLRQLIKPNRKTYFRTQPLAEAEQDTIGQFPKLSLTASKKRLPRKGCQNIADGITKEKAVDSPKTIRNKQSSTSIVDLDQVEARHGLEIYHRRTLSESWDELFRAMGGFTDGDVHHDGAQSHSNRVEVGNHAWPAISPPPGQNSPNEARNMPSTLPPVPGPRSSSITATGNTSLTRQSFQVLVAELPADTSPSRRPKPKFSNHGDWATETDITGLQEIHKPHLQGARSSTRLSAFGPSSNASRSAMALEALESEMDNDRPLAAFTPTRARQAFSINRTPPQPVGPPTNPPKGPLPELPEESDIADAASRASSHPSPSIRQSRPMVPLRSRHRPNPSGNSIGANLTLRMMNSPKGHHDNHSRAASESPKSAASISSIQSAPVGRTSSAIHVQPGKALSVDSKTDIVSFNPYKLSIGPEVRRPFVSGIDHQMKDMVESSGSTMTQSASPTSDILFSRSEHTRALKLRDLAEEKAFRVGSRPRRSGLGEPTDPKTSSMSKEGPMTTTTLISHFPPVPGKPFDPPDRTSKNSSTANCQGSFPRSRAFQADRGSCRKPARPIMYQSQIMVLAETDPETQMFRASTPTGSAQRTNSKAVECGTIANERKVRKPNSKTPARSHVHSAAGTRRMTSGKLNGEHTPPLSDLSSHTSDDDMGEAPRTKASCGVVKHLGALVKEDSDMVPAPSKRTLATLARQERKKYFREQLLLKRLKREGCELQLAMRLLSRGLEKLTMFVESDEADEFGGHGGHAGLGLRAGDEMMPVPGMAERLGRLLSPDGWEGFDQNFGREAEEEGENDDDDDDDDDNANNADVEAAPIDEGAAVGADGRVKSAWSSDRPDPIRLVSRFSSVRRGGSASVVGGLPIKDDVIWDQVDVLNRVAIR